MKSESRLVNVRACGVKIKGETGIEYGISFGGVKYILELVVIIFNVLKPVNMLKRISHF